MMNVIIEQNQKDITTDINIRDHATFVEFNGWKGVVSCTTMSTLDDDDNSSTTIGEEDYYSVSSMMSQSQSHSQECHSKNSYTSNNHNIDCIELLNQVAQRQSFTLEERQEVGDMAERVTQYHQQLKLALINNKNDDKEKEEATSATTCRMTAMTIIDPIDNDNDDESRMSVCSHNATNDDAMLFDQSANRGSYGYETTLPEYAFGTSNDDDDDKTPTNKEQVVVEFENQYNTCLGNSIQWEKKKKNTGNNNTTDTDTDTDTCTTATEVDVDIFSRDEDESSNYFGRSFWEEEEEEIYFIDDNGDDDNDDQDDDFIIQVGEENDDDNNDNSISMIDKLINQFELHLFELKNDIAIQFDLFEARLWQHQHQHQQQQYQHQQYQPQCKQRGTTRGEYVENTNNINNYYGDPSSNDQEPYQNNQPQFHPCKRIRTSEECEGVLPPKQPGRSNQKSNNNNNNNKRDGGVSMQRERERERETIERKKKRKNEKKEKKIEVKK